METRCHHESVGPPLKSFLFHVGGDEYFVSYARHVVMALEYIQTTFMGLSLHERVAILVPNATFRASLLTSLQRLLTSKYTFVDGRAMHSQLVLTDSSVEALMLDEIANVDGLEMLICIGVGLDSPIDKSAADLVVRSMIYRMLTRAQFLAIVVNELVPGGWLEFLGHINLQSDQKFDRQQEQAMMDEEATLKVAHAAVAEVEKDGDWAVKVEQAMQSRLTSQPESTPVAAVATPLKKRNTADVPQVPPKPKAVLQSIWDASANTATPGDEKPQFMPFKSEDDSATFELTLTQDTSSAEQNRQLYPNVLPSDTFTVSGGWLIDFNDRPRQLHPGFKTIADRVTFEIVVTADRSKYNHGLGFYLGKDGIAPIWQTPSYQTAVLFIFHPGMRGGMFRIEGGTRGHGNKDIGFTPPMWEDNVRGTRFTITLDRGGSHEAVLTDSKTGKSFTSKFVEPSLWTASMVSTPAFGITGGRGYMARDIKIYPA